MEIIIPLPQSSMVNTYKGLKGYLKQLELAIHHAQKAVDNAEESGIEITDDCYVIYGHAGLESSINLDIKDKNIDKRLGKEVLENFMDNYHEDLQNIELEIHLQ